MELSKDQIRAVEAAMQGRSIFITGGAGTGKSRTLMEIISRLRQRHPKSVAILAPTGQAALLIGGQTIHSFAGIDIAGKPTQDPNKAQNWRGKLRTVVIDEVSMMDACVFDLLDAIGRKARGNADNPFGGVQVILCGDFLQLPPVKGAFCFKSQAWTSLNPTIFMLTVPFRQNDEQFFRILEQMRIGKCEDTTAALLCNNKAQTSPGIEPTDLFATNDGAEHQNTQELTKLEGELHIFNATDVGRVSQTHVPQTLSLKINAQVVLLRNLDMRRGLVNGSRGVVVGFDGVNNPIVRFASCENPISIERMVFGQHDSHGKVISSRTQHPLALAWAMTIHKAQGLSLDHVRVNLTKCFAPGQAYVALSRCRTLAGLRVVGLKARDVKAHPEALAFYNMSTAAPEPHQKRLKME